MNVISVIGRKGGIANTTTAANLAAALALAGGRVLAIDTDSQGHMSLALGVDRLPLFSSWAAGGDLVSLPVPLPASAQPGGCLALVAGDNDSLRVSLDLDRAAGLARRLWADAKALGAEWVIVDTPKFGALQDFAVMAASAVVIPAPTHYLGVMGAADAAALAGELAPDVPVLLVPTMYDRTNDSKHWYGEIDRIVAGLLDSGRYVALDSGEVGDPMGRPAVGVLPCVSHRVAVAESLAVGAPIVLYRPQNVAALAYTQAAAQLRALLAEQGVA